MKPISDNVVSLDPSRHVLFVSWIQASKGLQAAILRNDEAGLQEQLKNHDTALRAYLTAIQGAQEWWPKFRLP